MKAFTYSIFLLIDASMQCNTANGQDTDDPAALRFNKFTMNNKRTRVAADKYIPLTEWHYPISKNYDVVTMLRLDSNAISVVDDKSDIELKHNISELIEIVGGLPDHPSANKNAAYWKQLEKVCEMREIAIANQDKRADHVLPDIMLLPNRWKDYTVNDVAEAVHDEYPGQHQAEFIFDLLNGKYGRVQIDDTIIPRRARAQFLHGIVMLADLNTWSVSNVGPYNFGAKWFAGRARPEEVAWKIKTGELEMAPQWIKSKIDKFPDFTSPEKFTNYQEGSPRHPSWPAMHSAASNISFWIQIVMRLTPNQLCEAKKVDYAVAYARTIAGVHFEDDNIAGLDMGQEIVGRDLPGYIESKYGTDAERIERKMENKRFKWEYYDPLEAC
mmetsp:Transcript_9384/g.10711  ORF Transcript_9384/g.10711 Transcript_9384/m.10711 type:complete len:385 (+) Transcript_9384:97-1251(+)